LLVNANPGADIAVRFEVAASRNFSTMVVRSETLLAQAPTHHTVKVRITNLKPRTTRLRWGTLNGRRCVAPVPRAPPPNLFPA
jgi:phosphodiesterase/alkaline phosphatase D-like protein